MRNPGLRGEPGSSGCVGIHFPITVRGNFSRIRPFPLSPTIFFLELLSCLARQQHTPELNLPPRRDSKWKIR
jgi:hypothetical protein